MPDLAKRLTSTSAAKLPLPEDGYLIHWCPETPGLGVRVSKTGDRAYIAQRRVDGKTVRRTLGKAAGPGAISADTARKLQIDISSELQLGTDRLEVKRERRKAEKVEGLTFDAALRQYVKTKRRAKDGLPLKQRTVDDYVAMLAAPGTTKTGRPTQAGELHTIATKALHKLDSDDIKQLHVSLAPRGERRQTYAMQVVRAVLRYHGVKVENDPLSPTTPGAQRVHLAPSRGAPSPIPPERLGAWWAAACAIDTVSADQLRFELLTGCRPGEAAAITAADVDLHGKRVKLPDTKNRLDHTLLLSRQAFEIIERHVGKKRGKSLVFGIADAGKTIAAINAAAGTPGVSPHKLRHTFASIADDLVSAATSRLMLNHASGDVTEQHYIGVSEAKLRAGWQAVADAIEGA